MRKAIWTLVTQPPDLAIAARPDENIAEGRVVPVMPLFLLLVSKQADVGPNLFCSFCSCCWHILSLLLLMPEAISAGHNACVKNEERPGQAEGLG